MMETLQHGVLMKVILSKLERLNQLLLACSYIVWLSLPCRRRSIPKSSCVKQVAVYVAAGRVVDLRSCLCDSYWARTLSLSPLTTPNSSSRLRVC